MQGALERVITIVVGRPGAVLVAWAALLAVLSVIGLGVETKLHNTSLTVPGTPSALAAGVATGRSAPASS